MRSVSSLIGVLCTFALGCGSKEVSKQANQEGSAAGGSVGSAAGSAVADRCAEAASTLALYVGMLEGPADPFTNAPAFEKAAAAACRKFQWPTAAVDCLANAKTADEASACPHRGQELENELVAVADESSIKVHDPAACEVYAKEIERFKECPKLGRALVDAHKKELAGIARPINNAGAIVCIKSLNVLDTTLLEHGCKGVPGSKGKLTARASDDDPPPPPPDDPPPPAGKAAASPDAKRVPGQYKMQKH